MKIRCWGCRGSLPTPGPHTVKYGGNTTCFTIEGNDGSLLIVDAGSGMRVLSHHFRTKEKRREFTLLITHAHWDHLMGFPFFLPAYSKRYVIHVKGCYGASYGLKDILSHQFKAPFFPVKFRHLQSRLTFSQSRSHFHVGNIEVESIPLNHPGGGVGYKFTENGKSIVFLTDNELGYQHKNGLKPDDYVQFAQGTELLIHDAQYNRAEYKRLNRSWGHSTFDDAFALGCRAGVKRLGLCHHDQERTDRQLDAIEKRLSQKRPSMHTAIIREGMQIKV